MSEFIPEEEQKLKQERSEQRYREAAKQFVDACNTLQGDITYGDVMEETGLTIADVCEATTRAEFYEDGDITRWRLLKEDGSRLGYEERKTRDARK